VNLQVASTSRIVGIVAAAGAILLVWAALGGFPHPLVA